MNCLILSTDEDEKAYLTDDFYYERATSLFNPLLTEGVPRDLLSLQYPFFRMQAHFSKHFD
jgi:hypothetical protein